MTTSPSAPAFVPRIPFNYPPAIDPISHSSQDADIASITSVALHSPDSSNLSYYNLHIETRSAEQSPTEDRLSPPDGSPSPTDGIRKSPSRSMNNVTPEGRASASLEKGTPYKVVRSSLSDLLKGRASPYNRSSPQNQRIASAASCAGVTSPSSSPISATRRLGSLKSSPSFKDLSAERSASVIPLPPSSSSVTEPVPPYPVESMRLFELPKAPALTADVCMATISASAASKIPGQSTSAAFGY